MRDKAWPRVVMAFLVIASSAAAQVPPRGTGVLTGTVYDSIAGARVGGADILVDGGAWHARADAEGRFTLRVPEGERTVEFTHGGLSAWSALRHPTTVRVKAGDTLSVSLATASATTVLERTCGGSGVVVGGVVRDMLTLVPLAAAQVYARIGSAAGDSHMAGIRAGDDGAFFVCAGPTEAATVELRAHFADAQSRTVTLGDNGRTVRARDLFIRTADPARVAGRIMDGMSGKPLGDATVELVGTRLRTLSHPDGRFLFRGVPPGAVLIAIERIGYGRREAQVMARPGDSVDVTLDVFPEAISLDSVVVTVRGRPLDARKHAGTRFDGLSRPQIERLLPRSTHFDDLLRNSNIPGLKVSEVIYQDRNGFRTPGICVETARSSRSPREICAMVEVYLNDVRVGDPEILLESLDPSSIERFQLLSRVEAGIRFGGTPRARNGVLLIWTRGR